MARNMFGTYRTAYMEERRGFLKETTWKTLDRRYRRIEKELLRLCEDGVVSTTSPKLLTEQDFEAFIRMRLLKGVSATDVSHDITALNKICLFTGNIAVNNYINAHPDIRPKRQDGDLEPLSEEMYRKILQTFADMESDDIRDIRPFVMVLTYICTGARNNELRNVKMEDLNMVNKTIHFEEVKGKGTYGHPRDVPLPDVLVPVLQRYLSARHDWLVLHRLKDHEVKYLFFSLVDDHDRLSSNTIRKLKTYVEKAIGCTFKIQDCRRAFGQHYKDNDLDLEVISKLMGHNSTKTTEDYYCRMRQSVAVSKARGVW